MKKMNWKWTLVFAAALVGTAVLLDALAFAGKPAPPPPPPPPPPVNYRITWLNATNAGNYIGMNDSGDIVGNYVGLNGRRGAFLYTSATGLVAMNSLVDSGVKFSDAQGINNLGQIVGQGSINGNEIRYLFTPGLGVEQIPLPPGFDFAFPWGINDYGDVVVAATKYGTPSGTTEVFVYDRASTPNNPFWIDTGANPQSDGNWLAINNHTQVVGTSSQAFRWTPNGTPNGTLELFGLSTLAYGVNDDGHFVGGASAKDGYRAYRFDSTGMKKLGTLGHASEAWGINDLGQVVGGYTVTSKTQGTHLYGFLYTDASGMVNLDNLVIGTTDDLTKWRSAARTESRKINTPRLLDGTANRNGFGQICGTAWFKDATGQLTISDAFLLTPEPK